MERNLAGLLRQFGPRLLCRPEVMEPHIVEEVKRSPCLQRYADRIVRFARMRAVYLASQRLELAKANQEIERTPIEGLGQPVMSITEGDMNVLCFKYGPSWFRDKKFREKVLATHPEMRPRVRPRTTTLVVDGMRNAECGLRNGASALQTPGGNRESRIENRDSASHDSRLTNLESRSSQLSGERYDAQRDAATASEDSFAHESPSPEASSSVPPSHFQLPTSTPCP